MQVKEGKVTYLVPSTLGIGLVEGYNQLNLEKSLTKPLLRRETEYRMSLICAGQRTKAETVAESIEEYRQVFTLTNRQFDGIAATVLQYLTDPNAGQEARAVDLLDRDEGDPDGNDDGSDADSDGGFDGPGGGNGRAAPRGRGRGGTATRGARGARGGRGRGGAAAAPPPPRRFDPPDDKDDDDDFLAPPPPRAATTSRSFGGPSNSGGDGTRHCLCGETAAERRPTKPSQPGSSLLRLRQADECF